MSRKALSPLAGGSIAVLAALAGVGAGCGNRDARPAVWSYISPAILQPNCATASCHGPAAAVAGLDFSDADTGYASLTQLHVLVLNETDAGSGCGIANGVSVCERMMRPLVVPYDPNESRLVNMLRARNAPRMPPDRPLIEDDIRLIERWILNGAKKDDGNSPPPAPDAGADADLGDVGSSESSSDAGAERADGASDAGADGGSEAGG